MGRYSIPDPKCEHSLDHGKVRVTSGTPDTAHASVWVCTRPRCIEDAKEWAYASTHIVPVVVASGTRGAE